MFKVKRRFLALFVAVLMVLGSLPSTVHATQYFDEEYEVYYLQEPEEPIIEHDEYVRYDYVSNDITGGNNDANVFFTGKTNVFEESEMPGYIDFMPHSVSLQTVHEPVTLTFHSNGDNPSTQTEVRTTGQPMGTLPAPPTKAGHIFIGWFNTSGIVFGDMLTVNTVIDINNTVFWARFTTIVTAYYELLVNVDTDAARNQAVNSINEIKHLFMDNFGIDLVMAPGSPRYEPALNQVPQCGNGCCRYGVDVLDVNRSPANNSTVVFKFVDYALHRPHWGPFFTWLEQLAGIARGPGGLSGSMRMGEMVVTTSLAPTLLRRTVAHEMGHVFGAHDCNDSDPTCVMNVNYRNPLYNNWCAGCRGMIHSATTNWWRGQSVQRPNISLNPSTINISDDNLNAVVEVGGTAQDIITFNANAIPAGVEVTATDGVITVTGTRPAFDQPAITGTFTVQVRRQSQNLNLYINVNLTPLPPRMQTISFTSGANASIMATVNGNAITNGSVVAEGSTVVFTAVPNAGFEISGWAASGGVLSGTNMDTTRSIIVGATSIFVGFNVIPTESVTVGSWQELRTAIYAAPIGEPLTISINNDIQAPRTSGVQGFAITIPEGRHITLVSSDTTDDMDSVRTLSQDNTSQRLFIVSPGSSLTLSRNITLCGFRTSTARTAAGVHVHGGGELIMHAGSVIAHGTETAVVLSGSGTGEATRARLTMLGGTIQNSRGLNVGGVYVGVNSTFIMSGNSVINGNSASSTLRDVATVGGVLLSSETSVFEMRDAAVVSRNFSSPIITASTIGRAGGVKVLNGTFTMYDGSLLENSDTNFRGAGSVFIHNGAFTMHGGSITGSNASSTGGIVRLIGDCNAIFAMYGGAISNNTGGSIIAINQGTMTMSGGEISDNIGRGVLLGGAGGGIDIAFTMSGGIIYGNSDGGVMVTRGVFNMTHDNARIENNHTIGHGGGISFVSGIVNISAGVITGNSASAGGGVHMSQLSSMVFNMTGGSISNNEAIIGGGIYHGYGTVNVTAGEIANNSADRGGGVHVSSRNVGAFNMTGGTIKNNVATYNGGGIYSTLANHLSIVPATSFGNLNIGPDVVFQGNSAGSGWSLPPTNRLAHIAVTESVSIGDYALNNYDINYTANLGQTEVTGASSWVELRDLINASPVNEPVTISISSSFAAPTGAPGNAIIIPAGRNITLVSTNTTDNDANVRILTQPNTNQRHFTVSANSSLTLGQNITLSGGVENNTNRSGGVQVNGGGTLVMNAGSVIENCRWIAQGNTTIGAVTLVGTGTDESTRAHFIMEGGTIRHNVGDSVGGVSVGINSTFIMKDGSAISYNEAVTTFRANSPAVGGVLLRSDTSTFEMNGTATIRDNVQAIVIPHPQIQEPGQAGGVLMLGGVFTMNSGYITDNISRTLRGGGAVRVSNGTFTMYDGVITGGAGNGIVRLDTNGNSTFTMHNGIIGYSDSTGVYMATGTVVLYDGVISNHSGGGIRVVGALVMKGGAIRDNDGTGVRLVGGTFTMEEGIIYGNRQLGRNSGGGGIYVASGVFNMTSYNARIENNHDSGIDVHLGHGGGGGIRQSGGTVNIHAGIITGNSAVSGGGVHVVNGVFNMTSCEATIKNNNATGSTLSTGNGGGVNQSGGEVNISAGTITGNSARDGGGVFAGGTNHFTMTGGYISHNVATNNGGGIFQGGWNVNITAGTITNNSAQRGGGVYVAQTGIGAFAMTGGSIVNNTATYNGGGIYAIRGNHSPIIPESEIAFAFNNLNIGPDTIFQGNTAGNGWSAPPDNRLPHINTTTASIWNYVLNNYDINFTGRLGQEHGITTWAQLRDAVNSAPANTPITLYILGSFEAPTGPEGNVIIIPANRNITLISTNQTPNPANIRRITQHNPNQHHFIVNGNLTLSQNITLVTGASSGGVQVDGGNFTLGNGSEITGW